MAVSVSASGTQAATVTTEHTLKTVDTFLKLPKTPPASAIYTNKFVGNVRLTDAEWQRARDLAKNHLFG